MYENAKEKGNMKPDVNSKEYKEAVSVEQMRESDRYTIENFIPSLTLMYRAAMGVYDAVEWTNKRIAIVCGSGNNGGDGYALAGILADNGIGSTIFRASEKLSADGEYYFRRAKKRGVADVYLDESTTLCGFDVVVDCVLGTGFKGEPKGNALTAIRKINESGAYVVSVDINSGLDGDSGAAVTAVRSDLTVSVGFYKKGMFLRDAPRLIGELTNVDIGIVLKEN